MRMCWVIDGVRFCLWRERKSSGERLVGQMCEKEVLWEWQITRNSNVVRIEFVLCLKVLFLMNFGIILCG